MTILYNGNTDRRVLSWCDNLFYIKMWELDDANNAIMIRIDHAI